MKGRKNHTNDVSEALLQRRMEINSSTVWGAAVAAPLPWSFVYFWYICLVIVE